MWHDKSKRLGFFFVVLFQFWERKYMLYTHLKCTVGYKCIKICTNLKYVFLFWQDELFTDKLTSLTSCVLTRVEFYRQENLDSQSLSSQVTLIYRTCGNSS